MLDKTGSMLEARALHARPEDLAPLESLLVKTGGELAVGVIRDTSNQALIRLRLELPPVAPVAPLDEGNRLIYETRLNEYKSNLAPYNDQLVNREREASARLVTFRGSLQLLTSQAPDAPNTDLYGAVARAELFLNEPELTWPRPTRRYLVLETDGLDNVQKLPITVGSGTTVIVVNGTGSLGALSPLNPVQFESLEAAFRFIVAEVTSGSGGAR